MEGPVSGPDACCSPATRSSFPGVPPSSGYAAMPPVTVTAGISSRERRCSAMRPSRRSAPVRSVSVRTTANSSPPNRAGVSVVRHVCRMASATRTSAREPARYPPVSLIRFQAVGVDDEHGKRARFDRSGRSRDLVAQDAQQAPIVPQAREGVSLSERSARRARARARSGGKPRDHETDERHRAQIRPTGSGSIGAACS